MNPHRKKQAARAVLEALEMAGGYALEDGILWGYANDLIKPPLSEDEKRDVQTHLEQKSWIRATSDSMDEDLKQWVITELGRNQLASL